MKTTASLLRVCARLPSSRAAPRRPLPKLIPRDLLFGNPLGTAPRLAPDGTRLAYLAPREGVLNLWVSDRSGQNARPATEDRGRGVRDFRWTHDARHALYAQDRDGDENWQLFRVDVDSGEVVALTPFEGEHADVVGYERGRPHEAIVAMNRDDPSLHDAWHVDLRTGDLELRAKNPGDVADWIVDRDLRPRGVYARSPEGGFVVRVRDDEADGAWRTLLAWSEEDGLASSVVGFSGDGRALVAIDSRGADTGALVRIDLTTGETTRVASDDRFDVSGVMRHPDTREIEAVQWDRARRPRIANGPPARHRAGRFSSGRTLPRSEPA